MEKVYERDIDLLVISKFINNVDFIDLFLGKINKNGYQIELIENPFMDFDGESDISLILEKDGNKISLLQRIKLTLLPCQIKSNDIISEAKRVSSFLRPL